MKKKADLSACHLGNGMIVYNKAVMQNGDYKTVAHVGREREVTWYMKRPTQEMKDYVESIVKGPNPSVSTSQPDQKVFVE